MEQDPQQARACHSLTETKGNRPRGALGTIWPARLGSAPWIGRVMVLAPASLGLRRVAAAGVWRIQKGRQRGTLTSGTLLWFLMPEGLSEVREPQGHTGPAFSLRLFPPPCSRDLKRDVAKKLEKLEKRTQRAIAELIRKCGARHGGVPCPLGGGAGTCPSPRLLSAPHPGERLKGQEENLASAVATTAASEQEACDSD